METYWPQKQKYYIFQINSSVFAKLTEVNATMYPSKPLIGGEFTIAKKKDKRTSMAGYLMRNQETHRKSGLFSRNKRYKIEEEIKES